MTHQEVKALAGHRAVPPWIMKLVSDAIAIEVAREREACAKLCEVGLPIATSLNALDEMEMWGEKFAAAIRARGEA